MRKIKHFQGYGYVLAEKLSKRIVCGNVYQLHIRVKGNHEYGLERNDAYDVFNWLVTKFDKSVSDYRNMVSVITDDYYIKENGLDVEVCDYWIKYKIDAQGM